MWWLYQVLLVAVFMPCPGEAVYSITLVPPKVEIGVTDVLTMTCSFTGSLTSTLLVSVSRVRILKETGGKDVFEIVAEVRDFETTAHNVGLGDLANVTGNVSDVAHSYLTIKWEQVGLDILGRYRCDVVGFKEDQDVFTDKSEVFVLQQSNVTVQDVIELLNRQKAEFEKELQDQALYCKNRISAAEVDVTAKIMAVEIDYKNISTEYENNMRTRLAGLTADVKRLMDTGVLQYWPEGAYALIQPDSGCPNNVGALWIPGNSKIHTESVDRNYDELSPSSHLMQPTLVRGAPNNFMVQYFCVSNTSSPGTAWPKGSYCINRVGGTCPSSFTSGTIVWQDELTNSQASIFGSVPDGSYTVNRTAITYCCRSDGPASSPVYLPKTRPFYLYRFNGTCQEVVGMQTVPEYVIFDTDSTNLDAYDNIYHPDGSINNVRLELCYYKSN